MILNREEIIEALLKGDIYNSECPIPLATQTGQKAYTLEIKRGKEEAGVEVSASEEQKVFGDWCTKFIGPMSMDLLLGDEFLIENPKSGRKMDDTTDRFFVDPSAKTSDVKSQYKNVSPLPTDKGRAPFCIGPLRRALAKSAAVIGLSNSVGAQVVSRLSSDLWGLTTSNTLLAPGTKTHLRVTVQNQTQRLFPIQSDVPYFQLIFYRLDKTANYSGYYQALEGKDWETIHLLPKILTTPTE